MSCTLPDTLMIEVLGYLALSDVPYGMLMMHSWKDSIEQRFEMSIQALRKLKSVISRMSSPKGADVSAHDWTKQYLVKAQTPSGPDMFVRDCLGELIKTMDCVRYLREIQLEPMPVDKKIGCYYLSNDLLDESEHTKWILEEHVKMHYNQSREK